MFSPSYFSTAYFPPAYFAPPTKFVTPPPPPPPPAGYRDRDAFAAIVAALAATGEFADVAFGMTPDRTPLGADRMPLAVVFPAGWDEEDDADPIFNVRHVSYALTLVCRDEDPEGRYQQLDRLTSVAQDALDGSDLGGCLPALTKLRRGRLDPSARHPEQRLTLSGEFSYLISTQAGHDTTA